MPQLPHTWRKSLVTHCVRGCLGPRANLDIFLRRCKSLTPAGSQFSDHPAHSLATIQTVQTRFLHLRMLFVTIHSRSTSFASFHFVILLIHVCIIVVTFAHCNTGPSFFHGCFVWAHIHLPISLNSCLHIVPCGIYFDCTFYNF